MIAPPFPEALVTDPVFTRVDEYLEALFGAGDAALAAADADSRAAGLPAIAVSPVLGRLLHVLARAVGARRILEIGTLGGYSTIWLARALPAGGRLVTLEREARHAEIARANLARAGVADRVDVVLGEAVTSLAAMESRGEGSFDFVFIDADKQGYCAYLDWAARLTRPGALVVADNVVRAGRVLEPGDDPKAQGASAFNAALARDDRFDAVVLQCVGRKGHDGLALAVRR